MTTPNEQPSSEDRREADRNVLPLDHSLTQRIDDTRARAEHASKIVPKEQRLLELQALRNAGTVTPQSVDLNYVLDLAYAGTPITRIHLQHSTGSQALVITSDNFAVIGSFDIIRNTGERVTLEPEYLPEGDVLILFPHDLGEEEGKPHLHVVGVEDEQVHSTASDAH